MKNRILLPVISLFFLNSTLFLTSTQGAVVLTKFLKPKSELRVCFLQKPFSKKILQRVQVEPSWNSNGRFGPDFKSLIQNSITSTYTIEKIGVQFTRFEDCEDEPQADIILIRDQESLQTQHHMSVPHIGFSGKKATSVMYWDHAVQKSMDSWFLYPFENLLSQLPHEQAQRLRDELEIIFKSYLFAHEFGHVLGLNDEHFRSDCVMPMMLADLSPYGQESSELFAWVKENPFPKIDIGTSIGNCDPNSIMSGISLINLRYKILAKLKGLQLGEAFLKFPSLSKNIDFLSPQDTAVLSRYYKQSL